MPTTYSPSLRLALPGNSEQDGVWGTTTNTNLGTLLESAIAGVVEVSVTSGDVTLTANSGSDDQSRHAVIELIGTSTGARNVIVPAAEKLYLAVNDTSGGFTHTFKTASGTGIALPAGKRMWIYCDGVNVRDAANYQSGASTAYYPLTGGDVGGPVLLPNGTLANPALSFTADPNTGFKWNSANSFSAVNNGAVTATFTDTSTTFVQPVTFSGATAFTTSGTAVFNATVGFNNNVQIGDNSADILIVNSGTTFNAGIAVGTTDATQLIVNSTTTLNGPVIVGNSTSFIRSTAGSFISHASSGHTSGVITVSSSAPSGGANGDIWFQT